MPGKLHFTEARTPNVLYPSQQNEVTFSISFLQCRNPKLLRAYTHRQVNKAGHEPATHTDTHTRRVRLLQRAKETHAVLSTTCCRHSYGSLMLSFPINQLAGATVVTENRQ